MRMKRYITGLMLLLAVVGCGKRHRFDYIDIAASELTLAGLREGFEAVPDSVAGGRTEYLLGQGLPVADVLVFAGEVGDTLFPVPEIPYGYACQYITAEELLEGLHIKNGRLYTDCGLNARMLYLQDDRMSLPVLNKISQLADGGAFIGGVRPSRHLDQEDAVVFQRTVDKVWLSGNVMSGKTIRSILKAARVRPDLKTKTDSLTFAHRRLPNADIYRICNAGSHTGKTKIVFRVMGRQPLVWNPDTGEIGPVSYKLKKRSTKVILNIVPDDETFIVFCSFADKRKMKVK